jgi:hypothetical protein
MTGARDGWLCMDQPHFDIEHEWERCSQKETCMKNIVIGHDFEESSTVFGLKMETYGTKQIYSY